MVNVYYVIFIIGLFFIALSIILWDWLSNRKSKKSQTKYMHICPKCKSNNVSPDFSVQSFAQGSVFNKHKCNNCGYAGMFFPEIDKKQLKDSNQ